MELRILCKHLVADELNGKFTVGENSANVVGITLPRFYEQHDLSQFSFRITAAGESPNAAVQIIEMDSCDEKSVHLLWTVTSDFTTIPKEFTLVLTGVNSDNSVTIKFKSCPISVNSDETWEFLPSPELSEQLLNQTHIEVQKAIDAAERAEKASQNPAPVGIYPAAEERLGGVLSGNDISVGNDGTVTVNSVNGKTIAKSVPENAVFTDTVYTLPKATTETLGGVKVDGKTITASSDGTISAADSETLKAEIADIKSSQTSVSNLAVQIAHPNNFLIYDDVGKPSVMVAIPKFYLDDVIDGASHTVHPAFIINGVEQNVIYISKYQNVIENGRAYSLPMKDPAVNLNFDQAWNYCKAKGKGWHLMTNAEWAAIALWCRKNGTMPKGNNYYGRDISETDLPQKAVSSTYDSNGRINKVLTGSGRESWYHDGTFAGIADLNGNVWEWNSGVRLVNGEIQILADNNAADTNNSVSSDSTKWKAIMPNGTLVAPGTEGTIKYSAIYRNVNFSDISISPSAVNDGITILEALCLLPEHDSVPADYGDDGVWMWNGEAVADRGGSWTQRTYAGVFSLEFYERTWTSYGFRCAYYDAT